LEAKDILFILFLSGVFYFLWRNTAIAIMTAIMTPAITIMYTGVGGELLTMSDGGVWLGVAEEVGDAVGERLEVAVGEGVGESLGVGEEDVVGVGEVLEGVAEAVGEGEGVDDKTVIWAFPDV
jgi:hypothetical protein